MASEVLKLTAEIVIAHAAMKQITSEELLKEIKAVYGLLSSLKSPVASERFSERHLKIRKEPIALQEIVKDDYVVCLECGKRMRALKAHLHKTHNLTPQEYYLCYGLDPKKFPLVCKEYSEKSRELAREQRLGISRRKEFNPQQESQL